MSLPTTYATFDQAAAEINVWFVNELATLRTGRATPMLIQSLPVEHYGTRTPLNGLASITSSDARTLVVSPWDPSAIAAIEKAITLAEVGAQPAVDGKIIRLSFPMLNEEMREKTVKLLHRKAEEARIRLRQARDEGLSGLKRELQESDLTEDDFHHGKKELDKRIADANEAIATLIEQKEADIRQI